MSETAGAGDLHERVETWLTAQMPIIRSHGGTSAIRKADPEDGEVIVELGGACSGCGISPRTAQRIKMDLAAEFDVSKPAVSKNLRRGERKMVERVVDALSDLDE